MMVVDDVDDVMLNKNTYHIFKHIKKKFYLFFLSDISDLIGQITKFLLHLVATVGGWDNIFLFGIFSPVEIKEPDQVFIPESFNGDWRS